MIPLFAVETLEVSSLLKLPGFSKRMAWFMENRPTWPRGHLQRRRGSCERRLLSVATPEMLRRILDRVLDEAEFLGAHGIRALSKYHKDHPYMLDLDGLTHSISMNPPNPRPVYSAATPIGGDQSGCPSIFS